MGVLNGLKSQGLQWGRWFEAVVHCGCRQQNNHQQEHLQDVGNVFGFHEEKIHSMMLVTPFHHVSWLTLPSILHIFNLSQCCEANTRHTRRPMASPCVTAAHPSPYQ